MSEAVRSAVHDSTPSAGNQPVRGAADGRLSADGRAATAAAARAG
ncbi:hypothetical protein OG828_34865 [Streptomyces sp. NBC_00457]